MNNVILSDIDGTLVRGSLERWFLKFLTEKQHIHWPRIILNGLLLNLKSPFSHFYRFKLAYLKGMSVNEVEALYLTCWNEMIRSAVYNAMIEGLNQLNQQGFDIVLLSGTPEFMAVPFTKLMNVRDIICARPEIQKGVYTGRLTERHPRGRQKIAGAERWLKDNDLRWEDTITLADHRLDHFIMRKAGKSVAVNPGAALTRIANAKKWDMIDPSDREWYKRLLK